MNFREAMEIAERETGHWEEISGQFWLEQKRILKKVNSVPPQCRHRHLLRELALLERRVTREKRFPAFLIGDFDTIEHHIEEKF